MLAAIASQFLYLLDGSVQTDFSRYECIEFWPRCSQTWHLAIAVLICAAPSKASNGCSSLPQFCEWGNDWLEWCRCFAGSKCDSWHGSPDLGSCLVGGDGADLMFPVKWLYRVLGIRIRFVQVSHTVSRVGVQDGFPDVQNLTFFVAEMGYLELAMENEYEWLNKQ
nr:hypothetical protein CFP56_32149 [Quercus suber]